MKISDLLREGEYTADSSVGEIEFTFITHELDRIGKGCLFICLKGQSVDTHYLGSCISSAGPAAVIAERTGELEGYPITLIKVDSCRRAMALIWSRYYGEPQKKLRMIGVTGTNGKTSTARMLSTILTAAGHRVATIGTGGYFLDLIQTYEDESEAGEYRTRTMTTPDPDVLYRRLARAVEAGAELAVMEVSSHALALAKVSPIEFELGLFTNLSPEHLDFHGNIEEYFSAKAGLFDSCNKALINTDDDRGATLAMSLPCPSYSCGAVHDADFRANEIRLGASDVSYTLIHGDEEFDVNIPIPGGVTVYNSLMAISAALMLGLTRDQVIVGCAQIKNIEGRLEQVEHGTDGLPFRILIDYAHTEAALRSLLSGLRATMSGEGRLILVFGCGGDRDPSKRAPMGRAAEELADLSVVTSDNPRTEEPMKIILDILRGMPNRKKRRVLIDRRQAIDYALSVAQPGDTVVLAGKGHEKYELVNNKRYPFDERQIVADLLSKRYPKK